MGCHLLWMLKLGWGERLEKEIVLRDQIAARARDADQRDAAAVVDLDPRLERAGTIERPNGDRDLTGEGLGAETKGAEINRS